MNVSDTEIAWSVLKSHGFCQATSIRDVSNTSVTVVHCVLCRRDALT